MIKLPVRVAETVTPSKDSFLLDADDKYVDYDAIAAALNAAPVAPAWQPIETMPMEGFFDVWTPLGHFTRVTKEEVKGNPALIRATHWKPSCAAPEAQGETLRDKQIKTANALGNSAKEGRENG